MRKILIALFCSMVLGFNAVDASAAATPSVPTARTGATPDEATLMAYAQTGLASARENLLHVTHEYGGHRAKATQAINTALQELKLAEQTDKK